MDKTDALIGLVRDLASKTLVLDAALKKQTADNAAAMSMLQCAVQALIAVHPEQAALRQHWDRQTAAYWSGLASADPTLKVDRAYAKLIQAQIESALLPRSE